MRIRCLSLAMLAFTGSPALAAGLIKCKVEGEKIVFHLRDRGPVADVLIGTLTSPPSVTFKDIPLEVNGDKLVARASPEYQVAPAATLKCADLQNFFHLELTKQADASFKGMLTMRPYYKPGSDRAGQGCKGFAAPESQEDTYVNVFCKRD